MEDNPGFQNLIGYIDAFYGYLDGEYRFRLVDILQKDLLRRLILSYAKHVLVVPYDENKLMKFLHCYSPEIFPLDES